MNLIATIRHIATSSDRRQYIAFGAISLAAVGLTGIFSLSSAKISEPYLGQTPGTPAGLFEPFFGDLPPLLMVSGIALVGTGAMGYLRSRRWFDVLPVTGVKRGVLLAAAAGTLFGLGAILAEASGFVRFDEDTNARLPWAMVFYPVIGYVVEVIFHLAPLALLLAMFGSRVDSRHRDRLIWITISIVALFEPLFQVDWTDPLARTEAWVFVHILAINIVQLHLFRRYGFVSMYSLRLAYYSWWHILWGYLRLQWLF